MEELMGPKDHTHIVKGKRTKRQRPQSPIPFTIPATNSSTADGGDDDPNTNPSPATSGDDDQTLVGTTTEEEEDMANCLILLAQGHSWNTKMYQDMEMNKFSSKKYVETANGKVGFYVYECKTCSRTFPSFQALGGHRASHKKPKAAAAAEHKKTLALSDEDDEEELLMKKGEANSLSLQLMSNKALGYGVGSKFKVHECSICGAEFSSGQALGGHMRRHRSANTGLSLSPANTATSLEVAEEAKKPKNVLSLDLNLPAPPEDHDHHLREPKFGFLGKQQQQKPRQQQQQEPLVLSTPHPLVDCHY